MMKRGKIIYWAMVLVFGLLSALYSESTSSAASKKLLVAVYQEPTSMDQSLAFSGADFNITDNWGEWLIDKTPSGELKPGIAASWTVSPDEKVIEFTLALN